MLESRNGGSQADTFTYECRAVAGQLWSPSYKYATSNKAESSLKA